jgi:Mn2+/Fe2+ NRAMP family transporter
MEPKVGIEVHREQASIPDKTDVTVTKKRHMAKLVFLAVWGPGLIVMLADTDIGSLVTAAQSGAQLGYKMILPNLILIPILYVVQEMTARLGILTGKGHGALIREHFGKKWGLLSAGTLFASSIGALLTEFAGVAGVGALFGLSPNITVPVAAAFLIGVAFTGSYRRVERIGVALGLAELVFVPAVFLSHPNVHQVIHAFGQVSLHKHSYTVLLAANIGAVIMPWMIFYQQGAVIDKNLTKSNLRSEKRDTLFGSFLTQFIAVAVVIVFAATIWAHHGGGSSLSTVESMARGLQPYLGNVAAKVILAVALTGAALVAALVASLAGTWGLSEVLGWHHSLNERLSANNAKFYVAYALVHIIGAMVVLANVDLVSLVIDVEVMNALLLPIVLGFLLTLEAKVLSAPYRMKGSYRVVATLLCLITVGFALYSIPTVI